jgi:CheY-like chemotaxis protein
MTPAQTILIADRQVDVLNILKTELAESAYALLHARNGEEAIIAFEYSNSKIELAIIDLDLPYFAGWKLIGRLRQYQGQPVKIIATTSIYSKPVLETIKECGVADAVVRKPIPHEEWRTTLETVMAGS